MFQPPQYDVLCLWTPSFRFSLAVHTQFLEMPLSLGRWSPAETKTNLIKTEFYEECHPHLGFVPWALCQNSPWNEHLFWILGPNIVIGKMNFSGLSRNCLSAFWNSDFRISCNATQKCCHGQCYPVLPWWVQNYLLSGFYNQTADREPELLQGTYEGPLDLTGHIFKKAHL